MLCLQSISALMIVYRIANGTGWNADTYAHVLTNPGKPHGVTTLHTAPGSETASTHEDAAKSIGSRGQVMELDYMGKDRGAEVTQV